jgi:hypothetical protein
MTRSTPLTVFNPGSVRRGPCARPSAQTCLRLSAAVPASHWARQPGAGRWSVAQQADHLLKAEVGSSKIVRRLIRGDYQGVTRPPGATLYDSRLDAYPFGPVAAPPALQPEGLSASAAYEQLAASHARFFDELQRFAAADPDALVAPDPARSGSRWPAGSVSKPARGTPHSPDQGAGSS